MKRVRLKTRTNALTLVEMLVIIATMAVLALILLPALAPPTRCGQRIHCVNNLKQIGLAYRIWAGDNNDKYPMQVSVTNGGTMELVSSGIVFPNFQVMSNELSTTKIVVCPSDSSKTSAINFTTDFNNSKVSYFVGLDANQTKTNMLLAGDRNLTFNGVALNRRFVTLTTNSVIGWSAKIHNNAGNVALADGSVQQLTSRGLQDALKNSGAATNRLVLP